MFLCDLDLSSSFITRLVQLLISVVIDTRCFLFLGVSRLIHLLSWQLFKLSLVIEPHSVTSTFRANSFQATQVRMPSARVPMVREKSVKNKEKIKVREK